MANKKPTNPGIDREDDLSTDRGQTRRKIDVRTLRDSADGIQRQTRGKIRSIGVFRETPNEWAERILERLNTHQWKYALQELLSQGLCPKTVLVYEALLGNHAIDDIGSLYVIDPAKGHIENFSVARYIVLQAMVHAPSTVLRHPSLRRDQVTHLRLTAEDLQRRQDALSILRHFPQLKALSLVGMDSNTIEKGLRALTDPSGLEELLLNNGSLEKPLDLSPFTGLKELTLWNTSFASPNDQIQTLASLPYPEKLERLHTDCEHLDSFPEIEKLSQLRTLKLRKPKDPERREDITEAINEVLKKLPNLRNLECLDLKWADLAGFPDMLYRLKSPTRVILPDHFCPTPGQLQLLLEVADSKPLDKKLLPGLPEGEVDPHLQKAIVLITRNPPAPDASKEVKRDHEAFVEQGFELLIPLLADTPEARRVFEEILYFCRIDSEGRIRNLRWPHLTPRMIFRMMAHATQCDPPLPWDHITTLDLSHCKLQTSDLELLKHLPGLTTLKLKGNSLTPEQVETCLNALAHPEHLTDLDITANDLSEIPDGFSRLTGLRKLNVAISRLTNETAAELIHTLPHPEKLTDLNLATNPIKRISPDALGKLTGLRRLHIGETLIVQSHLEDCIQGLPRPEELQALHLGGMTGATSPVPDSVNGLTGLRELDLNISNISQQKVSAWIKSLPNPEQLRALHLNEILSAEGIALLTSLEVLRLTGGQGDLESEYIADFLKKLPAPERLKTIDLRSNKIRYPYEIDDALKQFPNLEELDLSENEIWSTELKQFFNSLQSFDPRIRIRLNLQNNNIRGHGITADTFEASLDEGSVIDLRRNPMISDDYSFGTNMVGNINKFIELTYKGKFRFRFA